MWFEDVVKWWNAVPFEWQMGIAAGGAIGVLIAWNCIAPKAPKKSFPPVMICSRCGSEGSPKLLVPGSTFTQFLLLFTFVIPGVFYGLWREHGTKTVCAVCGAEGMIPLGTPLGARLRKEMKG